MVVLDGDRIYLAAGEHFPFMCPECGHVMEWFDAKDLIVCQKCDHEAEVKDFSKTEWKLVKVN